MYCQGQTYRNVTYLPITAQRREVEANLYQTKEMTITGNSDPQEQREPEMINKRIKITKAINTYLFSFLFSASLKVIKSYTVNSNNVDGFVTFIESACITMLYITNTNIL